MGFSRPEYWSGLPFPSPGDLPNTGIEASSPALAGRFFTTEPPEKPLYKITVNINHIMYAKLLAHFWETVFQKC